MSELLTVPEAAEYRGCSITTIYKKIRDGKIAATVEKSSNKRGRQKIKKISKSEVDKIKLGERQYQPISRPKSIIEERLKRLRELGPARKEKMVDLIIEAMRRNESEAS